MAQTKQLSMIQELVRNMASALSSASLYAPEHPQVLEYLTKLSDTCRSFFRYEPEILIAIVEDELLFQGKPLGRSPNADRLVHYCSRQKVGYIKFTPGFTSNELLQLIKVLMDKERLDSLKRLTSHIQLGSVDAHGEDDIRPIATFEELTESEKKGLQEQFDNVAEQGKMNVQNIANLVAGFISAFRQEANPFLALVPIRKHDEYTFTHSVDVGILNIAQGMALGIEGQLLHDIGLAGILHDVGKIFVDREILNKKGKLDVDEFAKIKQHPSRGAQYLMNQEGIPRLAVFSAYEHHMRYDLRGYPHPPEGWQLNICSQMTMISDTFDALRTRRAYEDSWDFSKASGLMLRLAGEQLNPDLTLNFLRTLAHMGEDIESFGDSREQEEIKLEIIGCYCALENPRCG